VELARLNSAVFAVRDTKTGADGPILALAPEVFAGFLDEIKQGRLDLDG
jgi:hypothetical protein